MADPVITNIDNSAVELEGGKFQRNNVITFAGADTLVAGTILAVDSVSGKFVIFVKGGSTNENGIPKGVLTYDVSATGAGDVGADVMVGGCVRLDKLVIDADGDGSNVDQAVRDQLRDFGIDSVESRDLSELDNA